jgi:hypothetical protein
MTLLQQNGARSMITGALPHCMKYVQSYQETSRIGKAAFAPSQEWCHEVPKT